MVESLYNMGQYSVGTGKFHMHHIPQLKSLLPLFLSLSLPCWDQDNQWFRVSCSYRHKFHNIIYDSTLHSSYRREENRRAIDLSLSLWLCLFFHKTQAPNHGECDGGATREDDPWFRVAGSKVHWGPIQWNSAHYNSPSHWPHLTMDGSSCAWNVISLSIYLSLYVMLYGCNALCMHTLLISFGVCFLVKLLTMLWHLNNCFLWVPFLIFLDSVLATLVKNKVVPDPFYGLGNEAILDIADSGREYYTFWFFTTFQCKLVGIVLYDIMQF